MTDSPDHMRIKMDIKFHQPVTVFCLQPDGWLPLAFASASLILVDRNIVATAKAILAKSARHDIAANEWWFNFVNNEHYTLNPILCALEGSEGCVPSYEHFIREFNEALAVLSEAFPLARVVNFEEQHFRAGYAIVCDFQKRYESDIKFLLEASKHLHSINPTHALKGTEDTLFEIATNLEPRPSSFVMLAALSSLYEPGKGEQPSIGRSILKPKFSYTRSAAHNAISDLRALELLLSTYGLGGPSTTFCTRDKALTGFWVAIKASQIKRTGSGIKFNMKLEPELFPRLSIEELNELAERLVENGF